jgi:hypothetical protein
MDLVRGSLADCRKSIVGLPKAHAQAHMPKCTRARAIQAQPNAKRPFQARCDLSTQQLQNIELTNLPM